MPETKEKQTEEIQILSAGRTMRGSRRTANAEYICCVNYPGDTGLLGLYGVADGTAGTSSEDLASEIAIKTLRNSIESRFRREDFRGGNILEECLREVNAALLKETSIRGNGIIAASIMCGYVEDETAHIAYAGGGAAYLVEPGKIMRLTEDVGLGRLEDIDLETLGEGRIPPGWSDDYFRPVIISQKLCKRSSLLFCSDGLISRLTNVKIQEILLNSESQDEAVEKLMEEARKHDDSEDVSAVLITVAGACEEEPEYVERIKYPRESLMKKYAVVLTMAVTIAAISFLHENIVRIAGAPYGTSPTVEQAQTENEPATIETMAEQPAAGTAAGDIGPSAKIDIKTQPRGAKIFINGVQEKSLTPAVVEAPAGTEVEIRVEHDGYQPYIESLSPDEGQELQRVLTLRPLEPPAGAILVKCAPRCDRMALDGIELKGFPRTEIMLRAIQPGRHQLEAYMGTQVQGHTINIKSDITQATLFRFTEAAARGTTASPATMAGRASARTHTARPRNNDTSVDVIDTQPDVNKSPPVSAYGDDGGALAEVARDALYGADTDAVNIAFFTIKSNVPECNIMIFDDGALVLTGFSDVRYDLKPGEYTLQATKPGYRDYNRTIKLTREYQSIEIQMRKE